MIRRASEEDIPRLCELEALLFPENSLSYAMLERELAVSQAFVMGDPIYAYALVGWDGEILDLLRLGVHPEHQGRGFGARLLNFILALNDVVVLTVKKDNRRALRLYQRSGFRITGHVIEANAWVLYRQAG